MGLLNHLFRSKKDIAKELAMDADKRLALWRKHLLSYTAREELSRQFSFKNIDAALQNFDATLKVLAQIEALILPDIVTASEEEKTEEEILADLEQLKSTGEIRYLTDEIAEKRTQAVLIKLFEEIHDTLKVELNLIELIKQKPANAKDLLLRLFKLIFHNESYLYNIFDRELFGSKSKYEGIARLVRAVLLEEKFKEDLVSAEEKFAKNIAKKMSGESTGSYRKLGEEIFEKLAEMAGTEDATDFSKVVEKIEKIVDNQEVLQRIIRQLRPNYDEKKVRAVALAFDEAYSTGHFEDLAL